MFTELEREALDPAPRSLALGQALPCHRTQNVAKTMVASPLRSAIYRNMFALGTLAFIGISLFMVHEFEEIIYVRPYIKRHREDEKFAAEMFIAGGDKNYPSTESIALMISEEFVLSVIIMLVGIAVGSIEIVLAPFIAFTLHLIPHALEALRFPGWAPGSRTAVLLLMPSVAIIVAAIMTQPIQPLWLAVWTVVIGVLLLANLRLMHMAAGGFAQKLR